MYYSVVTEVILNFSFSILNFTCAKEALHRGLLEN
jgi:hypothetical protein